MLRRSFVLMVTGTVIFFLCSISSADVPDSINYQGKLTTAGGGCLNDTVQMTFTIYADESGTVSEWSETQTQVVVKEGIFNVLLGSVNPLPASIFDGSAKYLGVQVESDPEMSPLKPMVTTAYAFASHHAEEADTADYAHASTGGTDIDWTFRVTDTADTTLVTGGLWGISRYGNVLYGNADSTHVNLGAACTTGTSGQNDKYCAIGGGFRNTAGSTASVGGGRDNIASGGASTVGGGISNIASGVVATVGGGSENTASGGEWATVGGGWQNTASGNKSTVGGGWQNTAGIRAYTTVGGGYHNRASEIYATVGGGWSNTASDTAGTVGGGLGNTASGTHATVPGGFADTAAGDYSVAAGSRVTVSPGADYTLAFGRDFTTSTPNAVIFHNSVDPISVGIGTTAPTEKLEVAGNIRASGTIQSGSSITIDGASDKITATSGTIDFDDENLVTTGKATIGLGHTNSGVAAFVAGASNTASNYFSTVSGGESNTASGDRSTVGGGAENAASGDRSIVSGGGGNTASYPYSTVGGGESNTASGERSTVGGGASNTASEFYTTVGGGYNNTASALRSTVSGGYGNTASGYHSIVGGGNYNINEGDYSVIPGGQRDTLTAAADYSMAYGMGVYVDNEYRVVFFDGSNSGRLGINRDDRDGGISHPIHVGTDGSNGNGAHLTAGGTWQNGSSRTFKENFRPLGRQELLVKISRMPVEAWQYKDSDERHIGPVGEDFVEAFDVGTIKEDGTRDSQYLAAGDVAGVALAGVKELAQQNQELRQIIEQLKESNVLLEARVGELEKTR